ncbi:MAG: hypothetical protein ACJ752_04225 [Gaiellaceae bacterium]
MRAEVPGRSLHLGAGVDYTEAVIETEYAVTSGSKVLRKRRPSTDGIVDLVGEHYGYSTGSEDGCFEPFAARANADMPRLSGNVQTALPSLAGEFSYRCLLFQPWMLRRRVGGSGLAEARAAGKGQEGSDER